MKIDPIVMSDSPEAAQPIDPQAQPDRPLDPPIKTAKWPDEGYDANGSPV